MLSPELVEWQLTASYVVLSSGFSPSPVLLLGSFFSRNNLSIIIVVRIETADLMILKLESGIPDLMA